MTVTPAKTIPGSNGRLKVGDYVHGTRLQEGDIWVSFEDMVPGKEVTDHPILVFLFFFSPILLLWLVFLIREFIL